ncbi:MAG: helix-turn-helix transcriptional regulator [Lachnospiraceae bacterium]|nr:helix-turn-helix transcriptional regulator [Lachnospiraceae bacterium]
MITIDTFNTGKNIKNFMQTNGFKVKDIQNIFGFNTPSCIYRWINGDAVPTIDNLIMLAHIFGVGLDDIVCTTRDNMCTNTVHTDKIA